MHWRRPPTFVSIVTTAAKGGWVERGGAEFFIRQGIVTALYEQLFAAPSIDGDIAHYRAFSDRCGPRILDAACGTGRIALALARPDRRIVAFDASPYFVSRMKARILRTPPSGRVRVQRARLESPGLGGCFDAVIVGYYGFNYVLDRAGRAACFAALAAHLRPGGRMLLHLPRHDLLTRSVPAAELAAMSLEEAIPGAGAARLRQDVESMEYAGSIRSIAFRHRILRDGTALRDERRVMRLAAVSGTEVQELADRNGGRVVARLPGFREGVTSEAVYEIEIR